MDIERIGRISVLSFIRFDVGGSAGNIPRADLEAGIEAAVDGQGFRVTKTSMSYNSDKMDDGGGLADLRSNGKDADHLDSQKDAGIVFPFDGTSFVRKACPYISQPVS